MLFFVVLIVSVVRIGVCLNTSEYFRNWPGDLEAELGPSRHMQKFAKIAAASKGNVSEECLLTWDIIVKSLSDNYRYSASSRWAFKLMESGVKFPAGIMLGGMPMHGSFDECLDVWANPVAWAHLKPLRPLNLTIWGQYCSTLVHVSIADQSSAPNGLKNLLKELEFNGKVQWRYDLCMPSTCSIQDSTYLLSHMNTAPFKLNVTGMMCHSKRPVPLWIIQAISVLIFILLGVLLVVGTGMDCLRRTGRESRGVLTSILLSFSVLSNWKKLLTFRQSKDSLSVVHGIRFLAMTHIFLSHLYAFTFKLVMGNLFDMFQHYCTLSSQAILNGGVSIDTFFFLSGLLLVYVTLSEMKKPKKITWKFFAGFYFHRFWRLTPAIFFLIMFIFVWPLLGSGPVWDVQTITRSVFCMMYGWATLLFVQNMVTDNFMCIEHSWYLAVDMQFYIISPLILIYLHRKQSLGLVLNTFFLLLSTLIPALIAYNKDLIPHVIYNKNMNWEKISTLVNTIHVKPWCRMGPFCVGIFLGYILSIRRDYKLSKWTVWLGWILASTCNLTILYGIHPWTRGQMPTKWVGYLYLATHGTAWSIGIAWMTFACVTGHGGIVNRILSMKIFIPLSRISYMLYLTHPYVIFSFVGSLRERLIYTTYLFVILYLGLLSLSLGLALVLSLAVESPFVALEKILFRRFSSERVYEEAPLEYENKRFSKYN